MSDKNVAPDLTAELASMTRIFHAACADLGAINEALGLDPDDGGSVPILEAIAELKAQIATPVAPTAEQAEGVRVDESAAAFALRALVAAGHVPQSKVDEALAIAANTPGVLAARSGDDPIDAEDLEKLPALAKTKLGKRLYYIAYARGRASERRKASGTLQAKPRGTTIETLSRHEMRLMLPEGGRVNLFWPDELTADSALMLSEMFATVMQAFARAATAKPNAAPASSTGDQS